ncbi:hypothetical protein QA601_06240 [Chitinispirillales bacterium ANBcel5]|uniref:hypothetical protein n=1 Tax=Cellulosispirillum alkaliphilum TaxID=3039283 RepID=UPI002A4EB363|nr:hypothetical protein [Chitinispirillales bacterium ANBcel5]
MKFIHMVVQVFFIAIVVLWATGCNDSSTCVHGDHSDFGIIEHGCDHMTDEGVVIEAASTHPGLQLEDFYHTLFRVVLTDIEGGKGGYIYLGPDITGDVFVMTSEDVPLEITNSTAEGVAQSEIERTFTAQQIAEETGCELIKKAIVFSANPGENIIKIGPTAFDTVEVIIEEGSHGHSH